MASFDSLRKDIHGDTDHGLTTRIAFVIPVPWKTVTDASLWELFEYYADTTVTRKDGTTHKAFTTAILHRFYTQPNDLMNSRVLSHQQKVL